MPTRPQSKAAQRRRKRQLADIRAAFSGTDTVLTLEALNSARAAARYIAQVLI